MKVKIEEVHALCKSAKVEKYSVKKISIGIKLFCQAKIDFDAICKLLTDKYEFFTYATKDEKPYKALLFGLDKQDPQIIKKHLTNMGLKCLDVKLVIKKSIHNSEFVIFVVYFQRQTINLRELRQNYSIIEYVKVKWEFQRANKTQITQCYNCQMYGHGSSRCRVKTFCARCAGQHQTAECKESIIKCANCNGPHQSNSDECESKLTYIKLKQRTQNLPKRQARNNFNLNYNTSFPNALNQTSAVPLGNWHNTTNGSHNHQFVSNGPNDLFSMEEIKNLTFELINNLRSCKNKADQFAVITNLACKFLS